MRYSYEKFLAELGPKLKAMRVERRWTYRDMIVSHGFHLAHWQSFEKGKGLSIPSLLRICEVFQVPLEHLTAGLGVESDVAEMKNKVSKTSPRAGKTATRVGKPRSPKVSSPG